MIRSPNKFPLEPPYPSQSRLFSAALKQNGPLLIEAAIIRKLAKSWWTNVPWLKRLLLAYEQDDSGWVIAESREKHLEPFLNLHYPAADIPKQARALYVKN